MAPIARSKSVYFSRVRTGGNRPLKFEPLESRQLLAVVISEFMADNKSTLADADHDASDWIELHNTAAAPVNLDGWFLTDDASDLAGWGLPDVTIAGGGRLVVFASGKDRANPAEELHTDFKLSSSGEYLGLARPDGLTVEFAFSPVYPAQFSDVSYGLSQDQSTRGYFTTPTPGAANVGEPVVDPSRQVVINEIMYHPASNNDAEEYVELFNRGQQAVELAGWRISGGVEFEFPAYTLAAGSHVVVAADAAAFQAAHPGVVNVVGGWQGRLGNGGDAINITDAEGLPVDRVAYADEGNWAERVEGPPDNGHHGWIWTNEHDGDGKSLELINPAAPNQYGQNWGASIPLGGTPGGVNSLFDDDIAPLVVDTGHFPVIPRSTDDVFVTSRVIDESPAGVTAQLHWRLDGEINFRVIVMADDGQSGDGAAGDGVFGAAIRRQADGRVVEFFVSARDDAGAERVFPNSTTRAGGRRANLLYQVNDAFDPDADWTPGAQPIYHLVMTEVERAELAQIGRGPFRGESESNAQMNGTFISVDGTGVRARYNVGVRNRGNSSRNQPPNNYRVNFAHDEPWRDVTAININSKYTHSQIIGSAIFRLAGLAAADAGPVQVRVNGQNLAELGGPRMFGSYAHVEALDSDFAAHHFPDDPNGALYHASRPTGSQEADLTYRGPNPDAYRGRYFKRTNAGEDDWSDLIRLTDVLNNAPQAGFMAAVREVIDLDQWLRYLALDALVLNQETGLSTGVGDDYALYRGVNDPRFKLVPHDLDSVMLGGDINRSIFRAAEVDGLRRLLEHPDIVQLYYESFVDLIDEFFNPAVMSPILDQVLGGFVPAEAVSAMKQFVVDRSAAVLSQIPQTFSINLGLPIVNGYARTTSPVLGLSGEASTIGTRSIVVAGQPVASPRNWNSITGEWSATLQLNPGINRLFVETFSGPNGSGEQLVRNFVDVWYDGPAQSNEYRPAAPVIDRLGLMTRDSYLPGTAVLVRIDALGPDGALQRELWDATATLSTDNPNVTLSETRVQLRNGVGSTLVTINGAGDFNLSASLGGVVSTRKLVSLANVPVTTVAGGLRGTSTDWSGVVHVTGDLAVPAGHTLTVHPGTLVLIDGTSTPRSTSGFDIDVQGVLNSLGTAARPVTFTAADPNAAWGEIHHAGAQPSLYRYTDITRAGHAPRGGHTSTGPAVRSQNSAITFDHSSIANISGKIMQADDSELVFVHTLLTRAAMGPEIRRSSLRFEDSYSIEMLGVYREDGVVDDDDGLYIHTQAAGQEVRITRGIFAEFQDDGIDTLGASIIVEDTIVRDGEDKALSLTAGGNVLRRLLVVDADIGVSAKVQNASSSSQNTIEHATIVVRGIGIQVEDKSGVPNADIDVDLLNSIIQAPDPIRTDYDPARIVVGYSNVGEPWPGVGNLNVDPQFVNSGQGDLRLRPGSPSIDAGDPASASDPDGTRADQGFYADGVGGVIAAQTISAGTIRQDTILAPWNGPYLVQGDVTVAAGATLHILPGTTVFFQPGSGITVNGRLAAIGSEHRRIRLTKLPGGASNWDGLTFRDSLQDSRLAYVDMEFSDAQGESILIDHSQLLVDNVTWSGVNRTIIEVEHPSLLVRNSHFPSVNAEYIHGENIENDEYLIIDGNVFDFSQSGDDVIDFLGAERPGPVLQLLNNIFLGGGDDGVDLDGTDAHIEGNIFTNFRRRTGRATTANAIATGLPQTGAENRTEITVVRNVFFDNDHAILLKEDAFATVLNNTFVGMTEGVIQFNEIGGSSVRGPGRGARLDGNIFWNNAELFKNRIPETILSVNRSLVPPEFVAPRSGNVTGDPRLADPAAGDFRLLPGSPAVGTGPHGLDMGALVAAGASISGEPRSLTHETSAALTVAGPGVTSYRYRLDGGPWSEERPVSTPITLSNLSDGSHAVEVVGGNDDGVVQDEAAPTRSKTWVVDRSLRRVVINEVLAAGDEAVGDRVELYNAGGAPIDLAGYGLSDDPNRPDRFVFPTGMTLGVGEHLVLLADNETGPGVHLGFSLDAGGEGVYLFNSVPEGRAIVDSVEFGLQIAGYSIGRVGHEGQWMLTRPTFGDANAAVPTGDRSRLKINEWFADGSVKLTDDFVELYNPDALPVALGGLILTDNAAAPTDRHTIAPLSYAAGAGFAVLTADGKPDRGGNHVDFRLAPHQELLGLFDENLRRIDQVLFYDQTTDFSEGRDPDGATRRDFFALPTPGVANTQIPAVLSILDSLRISEIMYHPAGGSEFEFIELLNTGGASLDLTGVRLEGGVDFTFPAMTLEPDAYVVVVNDLAAFQSRYGNSPRVAGEFEGNLGNGGDEIILQAPSPYEAAALRFEYLDTWHPTTDGAGFSLVIRDADAKPATWSVDASWSAGATIGGSPGGPDRTGPLGDTNGDGVVDLADLNNVRNNFGALGEAVLGDTNGDQVVDLADLNNVRNNFGARAAPVVAPIASPRPEPVAAPRPLADIAATTETISETTVAAPTLSRLAVTRVFVTRAMNLPATVEPPASDALAAERLQTLAVVDHLMSRAEGVMRGASTPPAEGDRPTRRRVRTIPTPMLKPNSDVDFSAQPLGEQIRRARLLEIRSSRGHAMDEDRTVRDLVLADLDLARSGLMGDDL